MTRNTRPARNTARLLTRAALFAAALALPASTASAATPVVSGTVVSGSASFAHAPNYTTITAANKTIIEYNQFNIARDQTVQFVQPSATARVLNRITNDDNPTTILGNLTANGIVYLVNPAGIYFGQNATVDVAGLYAAAGHISNADFLAQNDHFTGLRGTLTNDGTLRATTGSIALLGKHVINNGTATATASLVVLAAGDDIYIGQRDGHLYVHTTQTESQPATSPSAPGVENNGTLAAPQSKVLLASGDLYSIAIRNNGTIRARTVALEAQGTGEVWHNGTIDATSPTADGGTVAITGEHVGLGSTATVDASGTTGGGTIAIGGGYQGKNPDLRNATATYIAPGAVLRADATATGAGGTVVVWADAATRYYGHISARGATEAGGTAEVSGKAYLDFQGTADLTSANLAARTGTLLLDPGDIIISNTGSTDATGTGASGDPFTTDSATVCVLTVTDLVAALGTADATVQTTTGTITVTDAITWAIGNTLTLDSTGGTIINAAIDGGSLVINGPATISTPAITTTGAQTYTGGVTLADNVTLAGTTVTFDSTLDGAQSLAITGNADFGGNVGTAAVKLTSLTVSGATTFGKTTDGTAIALYTTGDQTYLDVTLAQNATLSSTSGNISTGAITGNTHDLSLVATTLTNLSDVGALTGIVTLALSTTDNDTALVISDVLTKFVTSGYTNLDLTSTAGITIDDNITTTGGIQTYTGAVTLTKNATLTASIVSFDSTINGAKALTITGDATFNGAVGGTTALGSVSVSGATTLNASTVTTSGPQTYTGGLTLGSNAVLTSTADTITISNGITGNFHTLGIAVLSSQNFSLSGTVTNLAALTFTFAGDITIDNDFLTDVSFDDTDLDVTTSGKITFDIASISTSGDQTYTAGTGGIVLNKDLSLSLNSTGGTITLIGAITGNGHDLSLSTPALGDITVGTLASVGTLSLNTTAALTTHGTGSFIEKFPTGYTHLALTAAGGITLNGNLTTSGTQTYNSSVTLAANSTLTTTGSNSTIILSGALTGSAYNFTSTATGLTTLGAVSGVGALTITGAGGAQFSAAVSTTSVSVTNAAQIGANITTSGAQTYSGTVTLANNVTLTTGSNATVTLSDALNGNGNTFTTAATGLTKFGSTVTGVAALAITGAGGAQFNNAVSAASVSVANTAQIGANITTTGTQTYSGAVTLDGNVTLDGTDITLASLTGAAHDFTSTASGLTKFTGAVSGVRALLINGTGGAQFNGAVTSTASVSVTNAAQIGANITTTGTQTYSGAVTLDGNVTLDGTDITLASLTGAAHDFTSTASGLTKFTGIVSGVGALAITGAGGAQFNNTVSAASVSVTNAALIGANITTTGTQTYSGAVTLDGNVTLAGTDITLASLTGAAHGFTSTASGLTKFTGTVSGIGALAITGAGGAQFNNTVSAASVSVTNAALIGADITTTGTQSYTGPVTLAANVTLTTTDSNATVTLSDALNGNGNAFTTAATGLTTLGTVSNVGTLAINGTGGAQFNGAVTSTISISVLNTATLTAASSSITTTGAQNYGTLILADATELTASTVTIDALTGAGKNFTTTDATGLTTLGAVSNVAALAINGTGGAKFNDAISATSISVTNTATLTAASSTISTSGVQNYGTLVLADTTELTASTVTISSALTGAGKNFTTNGTGLTTLGAVSNVGALAINGTGGTGNAQFNGAVTSTTSISVANTATLTAASSSITTTGAQNYGTLILADATELTASVVTISSALTGAGKNFTTAATTGLTTLGAVSNVAALAINGTGGAKFNDAISATSISVTNTATLTAASSTISTSGVQNYGTLVLADTTELTASTVTIDALTGAGKNFTTTATTGLTTLGTVSGVGTLAINGTGGAQFNGAVTSTTSISVSNTATLTAASSSITTTGAQNYGTLVLADTTELTASTVTISSALTGAGQNFTTTATGLTSLGTVSGVAALTTNGNATLTSTVNAASVKIDGNAITSGLITATGSVQITGNAALNAGITAASIAITETATLNTATLTTAAVNGNQTYGAIVFAQNTALDAGTGNITVSGTLASASATAFDLTTTATLTTLGGTVSNIGTLTTNGDAALNAAVSADAVTITGNAALNAAVSATSISVSGATTINTPGTLATTGTQTYTGPVTLAQDATLTASQVIFLSTIDGTTSGAQSLAISGNVIFTSPASIVGGSVPLKSLSVTNGGALVLDTAITTTGAQSYSATTITLDTNVALNASALALLTTSGDITIDATFLGKFSPGNLTDLSVTANGGKIFFDTPAPVSTSGNQSYTATDGIVLERDTVLKTTSGNIRLNGTLASSSGNTFDFATNATSTTLNGTVSDIGRVAIDGTATIIGTATLSGELYIDGNATLDAISATNVTISSNAALNGAITTGLLDIYADATISAGITADRIIVNQTATLDTTATLSTANGNQTYGAIVLAQNATLDAGTGNIILTGTLASSAIARDFTATAALTTLGGTVSNIGALTLTGNAALHAGITAAAITITGTATLDTEAPLSTAAANGNQSYGTLSLAKNATLAAGTGSIILSGALASADATARDFTTTAALTTLGDTVSGINALTLNGDAALNNSVTAAAITVSGTATLDTATTLSTAAVNGNQSYGGILLAQDATLDAGTGNILVSGALSSIAPTAHNFTATATLTSLDGPVSNIETLSTEGDIVLKGNSANAANIHINGNATFYNAVTVTDTLTIFGTLTVSNSLNLDSTLITTNGSQTYGALTIDHDATLHSATGTITISGALSSQPDNTFNFTAEAPEIVFLETISRIGDIILDGNVTFNDAVSDTASLAVSGTTRINTTESLTTTGAQIYTGAVTLAKNAIFTTDSTVTFSSALHGDGHTATLTAAELTSFAAVSGVTALNINGAGGAAFNDAVSAGSLAVTGPTTINTASLTTTGAQTYSGHVTLAKDAVLTANGGAISLTGVLAGNDHTATLAATGLTSLAAVSGVTALNINGTDGAAFNGAVSAGSLAVTGATTINTASLTTTGAQTYNEAVTLAENTVLTAGGPVSLAKALSGANHAFATNSTGLTSLAAVSGVTALEIRGAGGASFNGTVSAASVAVARDAVFNDILSAGAVTVGNDAAFNAAVSAASLAVTGATTLNTTDITTTGAQSYARPVSLAQDAVLTAGGTITLPGALAGDDHAFTTEATGLTSLAAVSGVTALNVSGAGGAAFNGDVSTGSLAVSGATTINTENITTTGTQTYTDTVSLAKDTVLTASGTITLSGALTGANHALTTDATGLTALAAVSGVTALNVNGTGSAAFNGAVSAASLAVTGATTINTADIITNETQTYTGTVSLTQDVVFTAGGTVTFSGALLGNGHAATTTATGLTSLAAVSDVTALNVSGTGGAAFNGAVSAVSLAVSGATTINTADITTDGTQTYTGTATLAKNAELIGTTVAFGASIHGARNTLIITGDADFRASILSTAALAALTVSGKATLGSAVSSIETGTGAQSYGALTLGNNTTLAASTVSVSGTLLGNGHDATTTASGLTTLKEVSGVTALTIDGPGYAVFNGTISVGSLAVASAATINTTDITTSGTQTYTGTVTLAQDTVLTANDGTISLENALAGANHAFATAATGQTSFEAVSDVTVLDIRGAGGAAFNGEVSAVSVSVAVSGPAVFNTAVISTSGSQSYGAAVLAHSVALTAANGDISFTGKITADAPADRSLSLLTAAGDIALAAVEGVSGLQLEASAGAVRLNDRIDANGALVVRAAAPLSLAHAVVTLGEQTYTTTVPDADIFLNAGADLRAPAVHFDTRDLRVAAGASVASPVLTLDGGFRYDADSATALGTNTDFRIAARSRDVLINAPLTLKTIAVTDAAGIRATSVTTEGNQSWRFNASGRMEIAGAGLDSGGTVLITGAQEETPVYATIFSVAPAGLNIRATGDITTGPHDTLLAFDNGDYSATAGTITIRTPGTATLGSINASRQIQLETARIVLLGARYQAPDILLPSTVTSATPERLPEFLSFENGGEVTVFGVNARGQTQRIFTRQLSYEFIPGHELNVFGRVSADVFTAVSVLEGSEVPAYSFTIFSDPNNSLLPTLASNTSTNQNAEAQNAQRLFQNLMMVLTTAQLNDAATMDFALREDLAQLGIFSRALTSEEAASRQQTRGFYTQLLTQEVRTPEMYQVADGRIPAAQARRALAAYREAFTRVDAEKKSVSILPEIQAALEKTFRAFRDGNASATPDAYPAWLRGQVADGNPDAVLLQSFAAGASNLFRIIENMGLTPHEVLISKTVLLRSLRVNGLPSRVIRTLIEETAPGAVSNNLHAAK